MNLRGLKNLYEAASGNMFFLVDTDENRELKKKLFSPPLQGMLDAYPSKTLDGRDIIIIPKTKKNDIAFQKLEIVPPESEKAEVVIKAKEIVTDTYTAPTSDEPLISKSDIDEKSGSKVDIQKSKNK